MDFQGPTRSRVFFEIVIDEMFVGRFIVELFDDIAPRAANLFRVLCTGERGFWNGRPLHYKGSRFDSARPYVCIGGGAIDTDNMSIHDLLGHFGPENVQSQLDPGVLVMEDQGNGTRFYICLSRFHVIAPGKVILGKVKEGMHVVKAIAEVGSSSGQMSKVVVIKNSGLEPPPYC